MSTPHDSWRTAVIEMKKAYVEMEKDPKPWLRACQGVPIAIDISQLQNAVIEFSRTIEAMRTKIEALKARLEIK